MEVSFRETKSFAMDPSPKSKSKLMAFAAEPFHVLQMETMSDVLM
jgi:hypothetical protein